METPDVIQLKRNLESLETQLISALHEKLNDDRRHAEMANFLVELKPVLDRIRPLVWVYLKRRAAQQHERDTEPVWGFELLRDRVKRISRAALGSDSGKKPAE
jgi:hypothetical protein